MPLSHLRAICRYEDVPTRGCLTEFEYTDRILAKLAGQYHCTIACGCHLQEGNILDVSNRLWPDLHLSQVKIQRLLCLWRMLKTRYQVALYSTNNACQGQGFKNIAQVEDDMFSDLASARVENAPGCVPACSRLCTCYGHDDVVYLGMLANFRKARLVPQPRPL